MATHSSTLAWKIPWMEGPCRLQSMGSLRVRHDWATSLSCSGEENGNPFQCSWLENPRDGEGWWAAIYGVAQSRTRLKWLSSSSSFWLVAFCSLIFFWVIRGQLWLNLGTTHALAPSSGEAGSIKWFLNTRILSFQSIFGSPNPQTA